MISTVAKEDCGKLARRGKPLPLPSEAWIGKLFYIETVYQSIVERSQ